jgi:parallel beta-helix repeat protein
MGLSYTGFIPGSTVQNNVFHNNDYIALKLGASHAEVKGNTVWDNSIGIWVWGSDNLIEDNVVVDNNQYGIDFGLGENNTVKGNLVAENGHGFYYLNTYDNLIYSNSFINNTLNAYAEGGTFYTENPPGGNYWSDYTGEDLDLDGLGDTPHVLPGGASDIYPLMWPPGGGALWADDFFIPLSGGATITFKIHAGRPEAERAYILLAGISGTQPGTLLPGGLATLPLNWDFMTDLVLAYLNTSLFDQFMGTLDAESNAEAHLVLPPLEARSLEALGGMHFAYTLASPYDYVSVPLCMFLSE